MQLTNVGDTWLEWLEDNADRDDATKLAALREIITQTARYWVRSGEINAAWANKKLAKLGIADRIDTTNSYVLRVPVSGIAEIMVPGRNRTEARDHFLNRITNSQGLSITAPAIEGDPIFTDGPEDTPQAGDPDAPATVDATLTMLREIVLLANVSGPRFNCDSGASAVLASYGLPSVPERKQFVVTRPVTGTVRTVVEAYDEETAQRIAGWRWDDDRKGYDLSEATATGDLSADEN